MQYYAPDNNRAGKRAGILATVCYLVILLGVSLLVSFNIESEPHSEGILIDFGSDADGYGAENVMLSQEEMTAEALTNPAGEEYLTQDHEDAPAVLSSLDKSNSKKQTANNTENRNSNVNKSPAETKEVNRKALFPGRSTSSSATSQGSTENPNGNRGNESGGDGSSTGTGTGEEGISFSLSGRRPVGSFPRPSYESNAQGRVVIEITVDAEGKVQTAAFRPHGSTTQDEKLREAALRAARQAKFTPSEANAVQTGTITYIFRLQ